LGLHVVKASVGFSPRSATSCADSKCGFSEVLVWVAELEALAGICVSFVFFRDFL